MAGMPTDPSSAGAAAQLNATMQLLVQATNAQTQKTALIPYSTSTSAGSSAGVYLNITIGGAAYKIALLSP